MATAARQRPHARRARGRHHRADRVEPRRPRSACAQIVGEYGARRVARLRGGAAGLHRAGPPRDDRAGSPTATTRSRTRSTTTGSARGADPNIRVRHPHRRRDARASTSPAPIRRRPAASTRTSRSRSRRTFYAFRCLVDDDSSTTAGDRAARARHRAGGHASSTPACRRRWRAATSRPRSGSPTSCSARSAAGAARSAIPAASQGTMNNVTLGGRASRARTSPFAYYETLGGGMGGRNGLRGHQRRAHAHEQHEEHAGRGDRALPAGARSPQYRAAARQRRSGRVSRRRRARARVRGAVPRPASPSLSERRRSRRPTAPAAAAPGHERTQHAGAPRRCTARDAGRQGPFDLAGRRPAADRNTGRRRVTGRRRKARGSDHIGERRPRGPVRVLATAAAPMRGARWSPRVVRLDARLLRRDALRAGAGDAHDRPRAWTRRRAGAARLAHPRSPRPPAASSSASSPTATAAPARSWRACSSTRSSPSACGFAQTVAQLAIFRVLLGIGMGGEWASGAALVSETWPAEHRGKALGLMQSAWAVGYGAAAVVNRLVLPPWGWRARVLRRRAAGVLHAVGPAPGAGAGDVAGRRGPRPLRRAGASPTSSAGRCSASRWRSRS